MPCVTMTVSMSSILSLACLFTASHSWLVTAVLKDWQLLVVGLFAGFIKMEKGWIGVVLTVTRRTVLLFQWRKRRTMVTTLVLRSAHLFVFLCVRNLCQSSFRHVARLWAFDFFFFDLVPHYTLLCWDGLSFLHRMNECTPSARIF